jgi:hypothetical protein
MKGTIWRGWTLRRAMYLVLGIFVIAYAIAVHRYWGAILGVYFAVMGILNFGCAAGACTTPVAKNSPKTEETDLAELKNS